MRVVWWCLFSMGAMLGGTTANAAKISLTYRFPLDPQDPAAGAELSELRRELHPVIPVRLARILLPAGEEVERFDIVTDQPSSLAFEAEIAEAEVPLSHPVGFVRQVTSWDAKSAYPAAFHDEPVTRSIRGHHVVEVPLYPLRILGQGRAERITSATVTIVTRTMATRSLLERANTRDRVEANFRVDNPEPVAKASQEAEGYLIIGPRNLVGTIDDTPLQALIEEKQARGLNVELADLETAVSERTPAAIRAFIQDRYQRAGIDYVLLVGDAENLPWKKITAGLDDASDPIPSDQYYACLDGDFTGRPLSYDWACEVGVGRVGARSREDVANWVAKTLLLQAAARSDQHNRIQLFGEKLDGRTLGSWALNYLITGRDSAPRSIGFPRSTEFVKLYEQLNNTFSASQVISSFNSTEAHVVNHLGHANKYYVFRLNTSHIDELHSRPAFYYTQGCYPNDPDYDNWTIRAVRAPSYGPAAMIANTRYGWYEPGQRADGTSMVLNRTFWSVRFSDGVRTLSRMNHRAKEVMVGVRRSTLTYYAALESNLIGDPEIDIGVE